MLKIAYAEGYPLDMVLNFRLKVGEGIVGAAVAEEKAILVNDVHQDPRYLGLVPGVNAQLVVPLRHKKRVLGALNLLSDKMGAFSERDEQILSQFGVHVAQALANARMFEQERDYAETLETLTEIAREVAEILDLDELLSRIAILAKRVIDYRTFGILLVNEAKQVLEPKVALQYGEKTNMLNIPIGEGLVGYSAQHKVPLVVEDVSKDPRYIKVLDDVRSELVVPLLLKDRCLGVFDLESPELGAFTQRHAEILGILASQAAVAIENARLYETVRASELRLEREIEFARRVQSALLPTEPPKRLKGVELAARFEPARQIGGDLYDYLTPDPGHARRGRRRRIGQGRARGALRCIRRRARALAHLSPAVHDDPVEPVGRARVDERDSARAAARGIFLRALLRRIRFQEAPARDGQLRAAVSHQAQ